MQKHSGKLGWCGRPASQSELVKLRQEDREFKASQAMQEESMEVGGGGERRGRKGATSSQSHFHIYGKALGVMVSGRDKLVFGEHTPLGS